MQFTIGLVSRADPAHVFGVHIGHIFVFAIAADSGFASAVVDVAVFVFELFDCVAVAKFNYVENWVGH